MDIVLEVVDTFALDYAYAYLLPAGAAPYDLLNHGANGTISALASTWEYKPASTYVNFLPSAAAYMSAWPRDYIWRQFISLFLITWYVSVWPTHLILTANTPRFFGVLLYFIVATASYYLIFDHNTFTHPKFLKNQVKLEMLQANSAMPLMSLLTAVCFVAECRGYSKLYDTTADGPGLWYNILQFPLFLFFTDFFIYLIHRGLHYPGVYKALHKPHHKWIMPTPFASHAFHPLDGFAQSIPYHVFPFIFPLQKVAYVGLFVFINVWTILIHDGEFVTQSPAINGAACHTMHHLYFNYNYGQYFTLWDRVGGSYRAPNPELFSRESKMGKKEWERQVKEMERIQKEVEGEDDRTYGQDSKKKI
jgi:lathosterol oxidase